MKIKKVGSVSPARAYEVLRRLNSRLISGERSFIISKENFEEDSCARDQCGDSFSKPRYSYVGSSPYARLGLEAGRCVLRVIRNSGQGAQDLGPDPFDALSTVLKDLGRGQSGKVGPFPFSTGAVGHLSYELRDFSLGTATLKKTHPRDLSPFEVSFYDPVYVFDHNMEEGFLVSRGRATDAYFNEVLSALKGAGASARSSATINDKDAPRITAPVFDMDRKQYTRAVKKAQAYITAGDIYQINIARFMEVPWQGDPLPLYRRLMRQSPSRFGALMEVPGAAIIVNSPERLLKVTNTVAETGPIKGTRPRGAEGAGSAGDELMRRSLLESEKERAEHVMVVDLERNDLGKVSLPGSVSVEDFMNIESYPTLHHMVSKVRGLLRPEVDSPQALKALFPGGSITGTPKIRATEIIEEIEGRPRGLYTGCFGYIDLSGNMDMTMAIRTAVIRDNKLKLGIGSGIVVDSEPEAEFEETTLKASAFLRALGIEGMINE